MAERKSKKVTISIPEDLLGKANKFIEENSYTGLSEFIRDLMRNFFRERGD